MTTIDEIAELRAELHHTHLTAEERRDAETRLADLLRDRDATFSDDELHDSANRAAEE
ncbi:hypothetical protein [Devosia sp. LjRoot3]|uniref:hypothetical protein n=1 Tax=Devosia sp. LjRoot3 TaxID=3342319 RepID=UPI003ECD757B